MGTRVLSLWLPNLAIDRLRQGGGDGPAGQRHRPRATVDGQDGHGRLVELCPRAERAGLRPGMSLADARRQVPGLLTGMADAQQNHDFLARWAAWCERYTPFVAIDRSVPEDKGGALWLDIGSSAHLNGGEARLLADLLGRLRLKGLAAKAAIADQPGSAWAACRFGNEEQRILPTNGARVALAPWPVAALRLPREDCSRLEAAGLDRIEHLYALPRRTLSERFGDRAAMRLDQALGLVDEPIAADIPLPAQQAQMIFAEPITNSDALPPLIHRLLRQLCVGLEAAGLGVRRLTLALYRVDNSTLTISAGTRHPCHRPDRLMALFEDRFRPMDLGFGLERVILDAVDIEPMLSEDVAWRGLGTAIDGQQPDVAYVPTASREPPSMAGGSGRPTRHVGIPCSPPAVHPRPGRQATALALAPMAVDQPRVQETWPRPLRLLRRPEPIEAIAPLPDEPPVLFRWRERLHKVMSAQGPETITPDWCGPSRPEGPPAGRKAPCETGADGPPRDYFAVEDSEGERFWLFREGRYDAGSATLPRWFLHGLFG